MLQSWPYVRLVQSLEQISACSAKFPLTPLLNPSKKLDFHSQTDMRRIVQARLDGHFQFCNPPAFTNHAPSDPDV